MLYYLYTEPSTGQHKEKSTEDVYPINFLNPNYEYDRLYNDSYKREIIIQITNKEWDKLNQSLINYSNRFNGDLRNDQYVKADMIYKDNEGTLVIDEVGFRTKGNTSRVLIENEDGSLNMSHFKIKFNEYLRNDRDDDNKLKEIIKDRLVFHQEEINLKYNRNNDQTYISEKFSYDLFNNVGVPAPKSSLTMLSIQIDDRLIYYGVYTIIEPVDDYFIEKRFGTTDDSIGNLYKSLWQTLGPATLTDDYPEGSIGIKNVNFNYRPSYDLKTNKDEPTHTELKSFISSINDLDGEFFKSYIESHFNVDSFLKYLALGVLIGNPDDYRSMGNNYYLYFNNLTSKVEFIPYDYDHSLGQGWDGSPAFNDYSIDADIYNWPNLNSHINPPGRSSEHPLSDKILSINEYRNRYEQYLSDFIKEENNLFNYTEFYNLYLKQKSLYDDSLNSALLPTRFGLRNSQSYFENKIYYIKKQIHNGMDYNE